ncbi:TRAP transporter substrate-binding protein DctP [Antarctobacter sp.]|uniref:TRAP transporter substrate-binding protein DctP n=1 Tax=Antarctobacter sp. TaxID=1872577 RepID=UPI003A92E876
MNTHMLRHVLGLGAVVIAMGTAPVTAELAEKRLEVIVGNHTDAFTRDHQLPFYNETLPQASGGAITARAVPYTELGLTGFEIMNLLRLGTNDISWGVVGYISGDSPLAEGLDLPGLTSDPKVAYQLVDVYSPIIAAELEDKFNAKLLSITLYPQLQAFCKLSEAEMQDFTLETLRGKNIRVHAKAFSDLVESFGGVPVTMGFGDVIPALERGVLDCAITSSYVAYGFNMGQVANAILDLPAFANFFTAANLDVWNDLDDETQSFLTTQFAALDASLREETENSTIVGGNCLRDGPCPLGEPSGMKLLNLSVAETETLRSGIRETVLTRWVERCGKGCAAQWDATIGEILGVSLDGK